MDAANAYTGSTTVSAGTLEAALALACHERSRGRQIMHTATTRITEPRRAGSGTAQAPRSAWVTNRSFTILDPALTMN